MADPRLAAVLRHPEAHAGELAGADLRCRSAPRPRPSAFRALVRRLGLIVLAIIMWTGAPARPAASDAPAQPQADRHAERRDRHGDPLPPGARARLGTTRLRSTASALALTPDGKTLLTAAAGRTIGRWDPDAGLLRDEIHLPGAVLDRTRFSPDGRSLAVLAYRTVEVWDLSRQECRHRLPAEALHVAFSPDGRTLAVAEYKDKKYLIQLWNLDTGKARRLADVPSYGNDVAFSPDGKLLFAAVDNHSLRCWEVASGKQLWRNEHWARHVAIAPDGKTLCTDTYQDGPLHLWDAATGKRLASFESGQRWTRAVAFSPDGRTVAQGAGEEVTLWDVAERKVRHRFSPAGPHVAFTPDGKSLIALGTLVQRWDVTTGKPLYPDTRSRGHVGPVTAVAFAPDGRALASCGTDATLRLWDVADGGHRVLRTDARPASYRWRAYGYGSYVSAGAASILLAFTPDGRRLAADAGGGIALTDVPSGKVVRKFVLPSPKEKGVQLAAARLTADGRTLLALGEFFDDGTGSTIDVDGRDAPLRGWDVATGRETFVRSLRSFSCRAAEFSPDGRMLLMPHGTALLDPRGKGERPLIDAPQFLEAPYAFSADSRLLAAVESTDWYSPARAVRVYETLTGRQLLRAEAALGLCRAAAFSPDGRLLAVAGGDALHVWEAGTGRRVLHLPAKGRLTHWTAAGFAECLAFAPDGEAVATGHADGTVLLWDLGAAWKQLAPTAGRVDVAACWNDLGAASPATAYRAIERLASDPAKALPLLRERVRPVQVEPRWVADRIGDLDSRAFATREAAVRELTRVAEVIESDLRRALERAPSLEVEQRLRRVLESIRPMAVASDDELQKLRAVTALERIANDEARKLLQEVAAGAAGHRLTRAAVGALERLHRR